MISPFPIPHSSFPIPHSPFSIHYSPFTIPHSLFPIPYSSFSIPNSLFPIQREYGIENNEIVSKPGKGGDVISFIKTYQYHNEQNGNPKPYRQPQRLEKRRNTRSPQTPSSFICPWPFAKRPAPYPLCRSRSGSEKTADGIRPGQKKLSPRIPVLAPSVRRSLGT